MSYQLRVPGPTPVPERVRQAMDQPMINHRGPAFAALIGECRDGLKWAFQTQNEIVIFPSSGTGGLEAAVQNLTSPGQKALFVTIGAFGDRFAKLGQAYGADVVRLEYQWGHAADPAEIGQTLDQNPEIRVVFVTHNETSTGVTNDLGPLVAAIKQRGRLLAVDCGSPPRPEGGGAWRGPSTATPGSPVASAPLSPPSSSSSSPTRSSSPTPSRRCAPRAATRPSTRS